MTSFYETLEVSPRASLCVIRAAYRCLAQRHHPDKNPDSDDAGERLTTINRAYSVLSDPEKRHDYDERQGIEQDYGERRGHGAVSRAHRESRSEGPPISRPFGFRPLG
ncbi:MAG: J domain-containing protein [Rhodoferax sp.]|nr:J domain-containing protein [Rhodoferax sp.]